MTESVPSISTDAISRRKFIQFLLGFSVISTIVGMLTPVVGYLWPKSTSTGTDTPTEVGTTNDFPVNTAKVVSVNDKPVIVVNTKAGGIKAFSAICTHLGCIVAWNARKTSIECPCHDGFFNPVTGTVVSGPPPKPLAAYQVVIRENKVLIGKPLA